MVLRLHGMQISGNGGYDMQSKHLHGHIEGNNLVLSKFATFAKARPNADGTLTLVADANGTMEQPGLKATLKLAKVTVAGKALGDASADMHSEGSLLDYTLQSTLVGAKVDASGQTEPDGRLRDEGVADVFRAGCRHGGRAVQLREASRCSRR